MKAKLYKSIININDSKTQITGDTYLVRNWIKNHLNGQWNKDTRCWEVNPIEVDYWINKGGITPVSDSITKSQSVNGLCPRCHTYCYGDCSAN